MPPINVVLAQRDPALVEGLVRSIQKQFLNLETADAAPGVREAVARLRAKMAIVDLEVVSVAELGELCREFPATAFVSTHRLADDVMWTQSLAAGALDCCLVSDVPRILETAVRYIAVKEAEVIPAA
jgi:DNA-binding NarL/FixJ family response regulator